jgi:hypothetical protein
MQRNLKTADMKPNYQAASPNDLIGGASSSSAGFKVS